MFTVYKILPWLSCRELDNKVVAMLLHVGVGDTSQPQQPPLMHTWSPRWTSYITNRGIFAAMVLHDAHPQWQRRAIDTGIALSSYSSTPRSAYQWGRIFFWVGHWVSNGTLTMVLDSDHVFFVLRGIETGAGKALYMIISLFNDMG